MHCAIVNAQQNLGMNCTLPIAVLGIQQDLCISLWHMKRSTQFVQYSQYSNQFL